MVLTSSLLIVLAVVPAPPLRDPSVHPRLEQTSGSLTAPAAAVHGNAVERRDGDRLLLQFGGALAGAALGAVAGWNILAPGCGVSGDYRPECNWGYGAAAALVGSGLGAGLGVALLGLPYDGWIGTHGALIGGAVGSGLVLLGALAWTKLYLVGIPLFAVTIPMPLLLPFLGYQLARGKALAGATPTVSATVTSERTAFAVAWRW